MKIKSWSALVLAVSGAVWFAGCDEAPAPTPRAPAAPVAAQTVPGRALERGNALDCANNLKQVGVFVQTYVIDHADWLPESGEELRKSGCPDSVLSCPGGGKYEFLVTGKVRNAANVNLMRCPAHGLILRADGQVAAAE